MAEAIVTLALERLLQITAKKIKEEVRLVGNVENEVKKLRRNLEAIQAVLFDAEEKQVKDEAVRQWLDQLKDTSYDIEDVLDEWNTEIMRLQVEGDLEDAPNPKHKVPSFFPCSCFGIKQVVLRRDIAQKIEELNGNLEIINKEKDTFNLEKLERIEGPEQVQTTSLVDVTEIYGREFEKNSLVSKLLDERNEKQRDLPVISLVGMGGIGKTTLAQLVYNNDKLMSHFDTKIWVCVSYPFNEVRVAKAIIEGLDCPTNDFVELESLLKCIRQSITGKKIFLVLDDVWSKDYNKWEPFYHCLNNGSYGSKVLITTRNEKVAWIMGSVDLIKMKLLSEEGSWLMFKRFALSGRPLEEFEKLEEIGREIIAKCSGLPLDLKTIDNLLRFKRTRDEWQQILHSKIWKLKQIGTTYYLPPLMLSYNDLSSGIRQCFSYCAIFPIDHNIKKDHLIKLWMAQGYLGFDNDTEMEVIGQEYFDHLASRSFFQEFEKDNDENIKSCKMHDMVHDFAQFLTMNECFTVEINEGSEELVINTSNEKARHSMLTLHVGATFPISICSIKSLRSLLIVSEGYDQLSNDVLLNLFGELTCLRALDICVRSGASNLITAIPEEVKKLIHLKYLKLFCQDVEKLPETLCELYNLQTLDISGCGKLKELPQGMGKLINLRHLINLGTSSLSYMPKGIEKLTCLRTLSKFLVNSSSSDNGKACSTLACLKDLKHLKGMLEIRGLGNVTNVSEVKRMQILSNKKNLFYLKLYFDKDGEGERKNDDDELLLEALQPPPNLEKLHINYYRGSIFYSDWIMSLTGLKKLSLFYCTNCIHLSRLGNLPSLEFLRIEPVSGKKLVTGIESDGTFSSSTSGILFPRLKVLEFWDSEEWEEWDYGNTILPCLASLSIRYCRELRALPDGLLQGAKKLQHLDIYASPLLEERYRKGTGGDWQKISYIPNIKFADLYLQGGPLPLR